MMCAGGLGRGNSVSGGGVRQGREVPFCCFCDLQAVSIGKAISREKLKFTRFATYEGKKRRRGRSWVRVRKSTRGRQLHRRDNPCCEKRTENEGGGRE